MIYLSAACLLAMFVVMTTCGVLLWRRRNETADYSRIIQAIFSWISALVSLMFVFRTFNHTTVVDEQFLAPEHTFLSLIFQMAFFIYPLALIKPKDSRLKTYVSLFGLPTILVVIGMCAGIPYTPIYTHAQLAENILKPDVIFRLTVLFVMLFYGFVLFFIKYDFKNSSASKGFLMHYAFGIFSLGAVFFFIQFTHSQFLMLLHQVVWMIFFMAITYYELKSRLFKSESNAQQPTEEKKTTDHLWDSIINLLENEEEWRNPDMTLTLLSEKVFSNRTYVGDAFKRNTGIGFSEYMSKRRIEYVTEQLKLNPDADAKSLFFYAGFRSYSTAWSNFRRITGMTVAEYIAAQNHLQA